MSNIVEDFANYRIRQIEIAESEYYEQLIKTLDKFSTTKDYDARVIRMIKKIRKIEEGE